MTVENRAMHLADAIDYLENEIKWHERNEDTDSWEYEQLKADLKEKESELRALGY